MEEKEIQVMTDSVEILTEDEYQVFRDYAEKFLGKVPLERLNEVQRELIKTLVNIDKQLAQIDELTQGKGFVRSVFEQKNALLAQRVSILKQLSELQLKLSEQVTEEPESIKDLLFQKDK